LAKRLQLGLAMTTLKRLWNDEEAANAVEYGLITAVIAVALIGALFFFSNAVQGMFNTSANQVNTRP
jgi:Flp pilus assembly pilin Flp